MVYVLLLILFYATVACLEVPRMLKNGMRRELYAFIVISALGFYIAAGQIMHFRVPNVTKGIEAMVRPVYDAMESRLLPPEYRR